MKYKVYFATDHAGFMLKNELVPFVRDELGYDVVDCGAETHDPSDDYPDFIAKVAKAIAIAPEERRGIILGGSGQGEAMAANRYPGVRAAVYYGEPEHPQVDVDGASLNMLESVRKHNDANVLSLGARFLDVAQAQQVVRLFLETAFSNEERHIRRLKKLENVS